MSLDFSADTIEKLSTVDLLCYADSAEQVSTGAGNIDQLSIGDVCTAAEHMETHGTGDFSNAEKIENLDKVDLSHAENTDKPKTVDLGDAEKIEKLDTADLLHAQDIKKPSIVNECNAGKVEKLQTVNRNAENKKKHQMVGYSRVKKPEKKQGKGRTDQSNPEDKDMYSTRSSQETSF